MLFQDNDDETNGNQNDMRHYKCVFLKSLIFTFIFQQTYEKAVLANCRSQFLLDRLGRCIHIAHIGILLSRKTMVLCHRVYQLELTYNNK